MICLHCLSSVLNVSLLYLRLPLVHNSIIICDKYDVIFLRCRFFCLPFSLSFFNSHGQQNEQCFSVGGKKFPNLFESVQKSISKLDNSTHLFAHILCKQLIVTFYLTYFCRVVHYFVVNRSTDFLDFVISAEDLFLN